MISPKDKIDFYNVLYFSNEYENYHQKGIWRAYRDFSRTLRFNDLKENPISIPLIKNLWEKDLLKIIFEVCESNFSNQEKFDEWHKEKTISLTIINNNDFGLTIGQSQKWINMTLKYLFLFGDEKIPFISKNAQYFHIPIDNIIQDRISKNLKINRIEGSWSRIGNYDSYLEYQKEIRDKIKPLSAFEFEFKLFNNEKYK